MMEALPQGSTIGIMGGGQLGRMLALAAARLGYRIAILEPDANCPAGDVVKHHIVAPYDNAKALEELAAVSDVITYEFENVPVSAARSLANRRPLYPPAEALEAAQDRLTEKNFLNTIGIATPRFRTVNSVQDLIDGLGEFHGNGVLKTRRLGYDGKGQKVFRNASIEAANAAFNAMKGVPLILEEFIAFEKEISIIAARGLDKTMATYDPAENIHRDGILFQSAVPADITEETGEAARHIASDILAALDYVGVLGVEFFVLSDRSLLVNEIAPRVHNSGHWTEAACAVSQFEQHIRAIVGLPLGGTERHSDCVMENLLGWDQDRAPDLARQPGTVIHLYGKAEPRPGRKMGHFTRIHPRINDSTSNT